LPGSESAGASFLKEAFKRRKISGVGCEELNQTALAIQYEEELPQPATQLTGWIQI
jgi:hypothetical protein